jgi:hypothetical protein
VIFFFRKMSSDCSPPRVRQRTEESIEERRACMDSRQVHSERNILKADLVDAPLNFIAKLV